MNLKTILIFKVSLELIFVWKRCLVLISESKQFPFQVLFNVLMESRIVCNVVHTQI